MALPQLLQASLEKEMTQIPTSNLQKAYSKLSAHYRTDRKEINQALSQEDQRISYIAARMPSTYESVYKVLSEIKNINPKHIQSVLDVGAGPGTASWACCETFDTIQKITLIEHNAEMASLGKKIAVNHPILNNAQWIIQDITKIKSDIKPADLVIASYSFNEIETKNKENILKNLWNLTNKFLIIIDPGTPESFTSIHNARKWFIENQVPIIAPCPHANTCPAFEAQDWCHFYARVQRTQLHKMLKEGEKGYEDEKFSYIILAKETETDIYDARILRHPEIHSGHLKLNLCTNKGLETVTYSKKNGSLYKKARKSSWGDRWNLSDSSE